MMEPVVTTFASYLRRCVPLLAIGLCLATGGASSDLHAAPSHRVKSGASWSAERLQGARPKPIPARSAEEPSGFTTQAEPGTGGGAPGRAPKVDPGAALDVRLYEPSPQRLRGEGEGGPTLRAQAFGRTGAAFSQSRVFPNGAARKFPFRAVGKLFAHDPVFDFDITCSATVIQRRLIATAGHCVFDFDRGDGYFLEDMLFIPAFDRGRAPFGAWEIERVWVAPSWLRGDGGLPNAADYAVLSVPDQRVGGRPISIGDVVGWLGWRDRAQIGHAALIGYPSNLDRGERMQVTHAELFADVAPNSIEFGSAQSSGASGGPIVEDLGKPAKGQRGGANRMISVISFGIDEESTLGGSLLGPEFGDLLDKACAARPGNCE